MKTFLAEKAPAPDDFVNLFEKFSRELPDWGTPIWKLISSDELLEGFYLYGSLILVLGIPLAIILPRKVRGKLQNRIHELILSFLLRCLRATLWTGIVIGMLLAMGYELGWIFSQTTTHAVLLFLYGLPLTIALPNLISKVAGEHLQPSTRGLLSISLKAILWTMFFFFLLTAYGVNVAEFLQSYPILRAALMLIFGLLLARLISQLLARFLRDRITPQANMLLTRILWTAGIIIVSLWTLAIIGYDLTPFLATAGVAGLAIGFAAQTTLSNVISGIFLVNERPYNLQDLIDVNGIQGFVEEIGLLSIFLRTIDNRLVRIPNEMILKGSMINITRYPIRRCDISVGVAYDENINRVMSVLKEVLAQNPLSLDEPEPLILFQGFGDSSLNFLVGAWCRTQDYSTVQTQISRDIKEAFDRYEIEIPFPHRTLEMSKDMSPIKVEITQKQ